MLFELPYMQIWTVLSNHSTRFEAELLASQVRLSTLWAYSVNSYCRSTAIVSHISLKKFKEEHRRESWYLLCCEGATPGHLSAWNWHVACFLSLDNIDDELEMTMVCHRPEGLEQLESQTNFTKQELQVLYRGFKNVRCLVFLISSFSSLPHLHIYFTQMSFDTFWNLTRSLKCLCNIALCLNIFSYESLHLICIYCPRGSVSHVSSVFKTLLTLIVPLCIIQRVTNHCVLASSHSQPVIFHNASIQTLY